MIIKKGATDITTYVNLVDSTAGTPETALTITNIDATYTRMRATAVKNDLTALATADAAHADNKGIEVDATNAPGLYRIDWPDAAFATGADKVVLTVTCTGCAPAHLMVDLVDYNSQDGVRLGLTALPNAAADAAGGLPISDAGGLDMDAILSRIGTPANLGGGTATLAGNMQDIEAQTDDIGAAGAGLTAVPWNAAWDSEVESEVNDALVVQRLDELLNADSDIDGAAPPTVGSVFHELMSKTAGSFTYDQTTDSNEAIRDKLTDIETDTAEIGAAGAGLTNINLPDQTMNITGDITGNLTGSVGSVTGAVGSVTGAVGSVTGTIGGLTAAALKDFFDTDSTTTYGAAVAGSVVKEIADNAGGTPPTAAAIADAVWDEAQADHVAVGSFGITASEIADILVDTAEIGAAGAGLTNINLPNQTMDIVGNITGNLSGSVGSVTGAVGSVTGAVGSVTGAVGSLGATAKSDVNAEVVDALNVDTYAEVGQETPAATQTIRKMLAYLYKAWRNKSTQDASTYKLYNDDAATVDQKATTSDDGTTFTRGETATGP